MKTLKFIDLFAGIGGFRIAMERQRARCVFSSEWDLSAQTSYKAYFGDEPHGDITKVDVNDIPNHDVLCGGFPCQAFSILGDKKGFLDTRGTLFFDIERILAAKRPRAFILENVKNLVSHDGKRTFTTILLNLEKLGYHVHWKVLNALDYGLPQKRERIVIVGFLENHPFEFPGKITEGGLTLADILEPDASVDRKHFASEKVRKSVWARLKRDPFFPSIWHENKAGNISVLPYSCALRAGASYNYLLVNGIRRPTPRENLRIQGFPDDFPLAVPDSQIRKQAGNAVPVPMIAAVARELTKALQRAPLTLDGVPLTVESSGQLSFAK